MTAESLCARVTEFGFTLLGADFALDARQHKIEKLSATQKSLTWVRGGGGKIITGLKIYDYLSLLERQEYSYLMNDGGIIQLAFIFNGREIARHSLSYYPCPFSIEREELDAHGGGLLEFITDAFLDKIEDSILLRSPIRFDYAPDAVAEFHPASHVTINTTSCRIPARSLLQFDTFMKFILENFYLAAWQHPKIVRALTFRLETECLSAHDKSRAYLNWAYPK
jgi:hypothetical protein